MSKFKTTLHHIESHDTVESQGSNLGDVSHKTTIVLVRQSRCDNLERFLAINRTSELLINRHSVK